MPWGLGISFFKSNSKSCKADDGMTGEGSVSGPNMFGGNGGMCRLLGLSWGPHLIAMAPGNRAAVTGGHSK